MVLTLKFTADSVARKFPNFEQFEEGYLNYMRFKTGLRIIAQGLLWTDSRHYQVFFDNEEQAEQFKLDWL